VTFFGQSNWLSFDYVSPEDLALRMRTKRLNVADAARSEDICPEKSLFPAQIQQEPVKYPL